MIGTNRSIAFSMRFWLTLVSSILIFFLPSTSTEANISESNVLVLYDADAGPTGSGFQIAQHYQQQRPGVHLYGLQGIGDILGGAYQETISAQDYLDVIRPQVLSAIASLSDTVDVIVTTKGLPLVIDAGVKPAGNTSLRWLRYSSLESELTRVDSIDSVDQMGDQFIFVGFPDLDPTHSSNPYYNENVPFALADTDPNNIIMRLSARLDGFDVPSVKASIDRAQNAFVLPQRHYIVADDDPTAGADQMVDDATGGPGPGLLEAILPSNYSIVYENTNNAITSAPGPVIGYASHGVADGSGGLASGYIADQLDFKLANGAVFMSHESWNASSFDPSHAQAQGLVGQWLQNGGTAGRGACSRTL